MNKLSYLSPSSFNLWLDDRDAFYVKYLMPGEKVREPQNKAMSVGSAFDAYVKSFLHQKLVGKDPKFEFETLFEAQVEPQCRDTARKDGLYVWINYQQNGGLASLMEEMEGSIGPPTFEIDISGIVEMRGRTLGGVPLLGKPDLYFRSKTTARMVVDWKVNGMYNIKGEYHQTGASPKKYYIKSFPDFDIHTECVPGKHNGMYIHTGHTFDQVDRTWAIQLCIYSWLLGEHVGSDFIAAIDQLVCRTNKSSPGRPHVRSVKHRMLISPEFQTWLFEKLHECWYGLQNDHVFTELPLSESKARCEMLSQPVQEMTVDVKTFDRER